MVMPKAKKCSEFKIVFTQKRRVGDHLLLLASAAISRLQFHINLSLNTNKVGLNGADFI
jgi:hypothetical protein